jgi:hypothetical protein
MFPSRMAFLLCTPGDVFQHYCREYAIYASYTVLALVGRLRVDPAPTIAAHHARPSCGSGRGSFDVPRLSLYEICGASHSRSVSFPRMLEASFLLLRDSSLLALLPLDCGIIFGH